MSIKRLKRTRDLVSVWVVPCLIYYLWTWDATGLKVAGTAFLIAFVLGIIIHNREKEKERKEQSNRHWIVIDEYAHLVDLEERKN